MTCGDKNLAWATYGATPGVVNSLLFLLKNIIQTERTRSYLVLEMNPRCCLVPPTIGTELKLADGQADRIEGATPLKEAGAKSTRFGHLSPAPAGCE